MFDSFKLVNATRLLLSIAYGAFCCGALFFISKYVPINEQYAVPVIEECLKGILLLILVKNNKIGFQIDAFIYGAAIGGGFALVEDIIYLAFNPEMTLVTALFRGFGTSIMHMGLTAIVGILLVSIKKRNSWTIFLCYPLILIPSAGYHIVYNLFIFHPLYSLLFAVISLSLIIALLFRYNEKKISSWLDESLYSDVNLYSAIKKGDFSSTNAGKYMMTIKEHFAPEVFFDMCCYVNLFLEMSILSKRNLMLQEAGVTMPDDKAEKQAADAMVQEFYALKKRIGKTGEMSLTPIVKVKEVDKWMIESLIK